MARGHESSETPSGHQHYQTLYRRADTAVGAYCKRHYIDRSELDAQLPALLVLHKLAYPAASGKGSKFSIPVICEDLATLWALEASV